jgi:threonine/homoserine/homoserine lactone efflux protein
VRLAAVLGFLAVVAPISMSPGTSLTMVVSGVTTSGRRHGWWVVAGTVTGLYVHGLLAAAGLAALVLHSAQGFRVVQAAGAARAPGCCAPTAPGGRSTGSAARSW